MPDEEAKKVNPEEDIREIARHVAVAAGKIGTTVELREDVSALAVAVQELVAEVKPLAEALPTLARKEELTDAQRGRRRLIWSIIAVAALLAIGFAANRIALNAARDDTCLAINRQNAILRDLVANSTALSDRPIDPNLPAEFQQGLRESRERQEQFRQKAMDDLAASKC